MKIKLDLLYEEATEVRAWLTQVLASASAYDVQSEHLRRGLQHIEQRLSHQIAYAGPQTTSQASPTRKDGLA